MEPSPAPLSEWIYRRGLDGFRGLRRYHQHEIHGLHHIPRTGPGLMVFNHSLATYDSFLVGALIAETLGRRMLGIGDRLLFQLPGVGRVFRDLGFCPGSRPQIAQALRDGELIGLSPGGMREGLGISRERYTVDWSDRFGFVLMSLLTGAPIILAACPSADDIYRVYHNPLTPRVYARLRLPLPLFRGRGPTWLPRPVPLRHHIGAPIEPPPLPSGIDAETVLRGGQRDPVLQELCREHHRTVETRMQDLMASAHQADIEHGRAPRARATRSRASTGT